MSLAENSPFPTLRRLSADCGSTWTGFQIAGSETAKAEANLRKAIANSDLTNRPLDSDSALIIFGSFARCEMVAGSDYDWSLLIDGVVNAEHAKQSSSIS